MQSAMQMGFQDARFRAIDLEPSSVFVLLEARKVKAIGHR